MMITDLRIHGQIEGGREFFATLRGEEVGHRYFHEVLEQDGQPCHRFFSGPNEFLLGPEGFSHRGNGGSFCPYMFGVDEPMEDMVKAGVINRLVLFGALGGEAGEKDRRLLITDKTMGTETFREIFLRGHAVFNYFFFVHIPGDEPQEKQQEEILRRMGRILKRHPLSLDADDSKIAEELFGLWKGERVVLFLLRLVHRPHLEYYRRFESLYAQSRQLSEEDTASLQETAGVLQLDPYAQERIRIDVLFRHPDNRKVVEEFRTALIDIWKRDEMTLDDRARLTRLRTLAIRRDIPTNLLDALEGKLLGGKSFEQGKEPPYLLEARVALETLFLKTRKVGAHMEKEDLLRLIRAKHAALENRDMAFDSVLLEVGRQCDELANRMGQASILEDFGSLVTYFDRFDAIYHDINLLAFHEEEGLAEDRLRSLLRNKRIFDEIQAGLFAELFIQPVLGNSYLPLYGRKKIEALFHGLAQIETGDTSIQDLAALLADLVREEREYRVVKSVMEGWLKKLGRPLRGEKEEESFRRSVKNHLVTRGTIRSTVPEEVVSRALGELKVERMYLTAILPRLIKEKNPRLREDFLRSSGVEVLRLEELEREFIRQYRLDERVLDQIRGATAAAGGGI